MAAALLVPYFLTVCAGYGVGAILATAADAGLEYVNFTEIDGDYHVTAPLRVYEVGWSDPTPIESPWGEAHAPEVLHPIAGSRIVAYSPYSAPPGSSARYVAWQISRAAEAVYGASILPGWIEDRYLVTHEDGRVTARAGGLELRRDDPSLKPRGGPKLPALLALTVFPWLVLTALLLRAYRPGIGEWVRQTIVWGSLAALLVFAIGSSIATVQGIIEPWTIRALVEIPVMRLGATTAGTVAVWVVAGLLIAGAYRFAEAQFLRMEIPARPSRYTLIGMGGC